jgi:hypothetical protein
MLNAMNVTQREIFLADRIWIAVALLHQESPLRDGFTKDEIRHKLRETGLMVGLKAGSVAAHLKEHMVANVPPSSTKYRMLYEIQDGTQCGCDPVSLRGACRSRSLYYERRSASKS